MLSLCNVDIPILSNSCSAVSVSIDLPVYGQRLYLKVASNGNYLF